MLSNGKSPAKNLPPFLCTARLQYIFKQLPTQAMAVWVTTNMPLKWLRLTMAGAFLVLLLVRQSIGIFAVGDNQLVFWERSVQKGAVYKKGNKILPGMNQLVHTVTAWTEPTRREFPASLSKMSPLF